MRERLECLRPTFPKLTSFRPNRPQCDNTVKGLEPEDQVLLFLPSKLLAKWQGPYEAFQWVEQVDYKIHCPEKRKQRQIYHVNLLKSWKVQEILFIHLEEGEEVLGPQLPKLAKTGSEEVPSEG